MHHQGDFLIRVAATFKWRTILELHHSMATSKFTTCNGLLKPREHRSVDDDEGRRDRDSGTERSGLTRQQNMHRPRRGAVLTT
jgi:hypothetical protein